MIHIICMECKHGLCVSPGDMHGRLSEAEALLGHGSEFYPDKYPCWHCKEKMAEFVAVADVAALRLINIHDVSPQEAMAAIHGLGLPDEQDCSAAAVERLFEGQKVTRVFATSIRNSHRSILKVIEFADGSKLHLGSSAFGATVYRISKPHSYVEALSHA